MAFGILSFKNVIALICVIQCLMIPVSSIRCVHCIADEDGHCMLPYSEKGYEIECPADYDSRLETVDRTILGRVVMRCLYDFARGSKTTGQSSSFTYRTNAEYACMTAKGNMEGETFIYKDCVIKPVVGGCEYAKLVGLGGLHLHSCEDCDTDLCNSANNYNPCIMFIYFLPALASLYSGIF